MLQWSNRVVNALGMYGRRPSQVLPLRGSINTASSADLYRVLRAYYTSNGLYDVLRDLLRRQGIWAEALKPMKNPAYRVVEFYPSHLWPGTLPDALPIQAKKKAIIKPIEQVWQWSNWGSKKQVAARHLALYGDLFIKVSTISANDAVQRVFFQLLEPEHVTEFDTDERDFLTYVRLDVPRTRRNADGTSTSYWHTEEWNKATMGYRTWEHDQGPHTDILQLGSPNVTAEIPSFGIDFIPITHAKFADIGEDRGMGALVPALDKIDEANRQATRLAQMLFRNLGGVWALEANSVDASGRPLPPPRISESDAVNDDDGTITLGDDRLIKLPGMSKLASLVPDIDYEAALKILQDHMMELEQDLPELVSYRLAQDRDISGRAVRLMLGPAIKRLEEARGNAEGALVRADQMALTIGQVHGLFSRLGTFERGDFDHEFEVRDVLPTDALEESQTNQANAQAIKSLVEAGVPVEMAVKEVLGWEEEQAAQFTVERLAAIQREQALAQEDMPPEGEVALEQ